MRISIRFQDYFANATQLSLHSNVGCRTQQGLLSKLEQVCASHTTPPVSVTDRVHSCLYPTNYPDGTGLVFRFGCIFIFLLLICWLLELVTNRHFGNEMCFAEPYEGQIIHLRGLNPATLSLVHPWMSGPQDGQSLGAHRAGRVQVFILSSV